MTYRGKITLLLPDGEIEATGLAAGPDWTVPATRIRVARRAFAVILVGQGSAPF